VVHFPTDIGEAQGKKCCRGCDLARNADMFVFAWKSGKHQAFYCVKEAMRGRDIIMPTGKGTASIVKSVLDSIASN
jgi:hypothetical protein